MLICLLTFPIISHNLAEKVVKDAIGCICFWTLTCTALSKDVVVYKDYSGVQGVIC